MTITGCRSLSITWKGAGHSGQRFTAFTFSKSDYDPTVAGVGPNGTWTKVETSNKNEWDWTGTPESYEFHSAFLIDATDISLTNWVSVRCNGWTEETDMSGMFNNCTAIVSAKNVRNDRRYKHVHNV